MILLLLVALVCYAALAVLLMVRFRFGRLRSIRVIWAALVSSGTAGAWTLLFDQPAGGPGPLPLADAVLVTNLILFFAVSIGPNLVGLVLVERGLMRRRWWRDVSISGLWVVPVGAAYGMAVLLVAVAPVAALGGSGLVLRFLLHPYVVLPAVLAGVVAVGVLWLLEPREFR
jgi:hypothetical protein